jgi:tetratricopeptide (TPR) repeat protein
VSQGQRAEALKAYRDSLSIRERLAKADPGNAGWQRDLAINKERIGDILVREGKAEEAIAAFERAAAIYADLVKRNPGDVQSRLFSVVPFWRLGELKGQEGGAYLEAALAILRPLAKANRLDARRKNWIPQIEAALARLEEPTPYKQETAAIQSAFEAKDFARAAALQESLAGAVEKAETEQSHKPGPATADALVRVSWYALFAHDFGKALSASERAATLAPDEAQLMIATNKAHALVCLGRADEARALYARHRGKEVSGQGKWEAVILSDFAQLRARGVNCPKMDEIEAMLKETATRAAPAR